MDTSRISFGEMIAAVSGFCLLVVMFLPWYGLSADIGTPASSANAWGSFGLIDFLLFLVALVAIGVAAARAADAMPAELPVPPGQILTGAGGLAVLLILFRLIDTPAPDVSEVDVSPKIGAFLGLLAAAGVAFGGYTAMSEEGTGRAAPRPRRRGPPAA